jgi:phenylacetate-CoA ligase
MLTLDDAPYPARSQDDIRAIHKARLPIAVQRARRSRFFEGRLDHIDLDRLDDPEEWRKIPIMTKDQLRGVPAERFYEDFCIAPREDVIEYWRSGGATGRPLFYPRSAEDMHYGMEPFRRLLRAAGCTPDDMVHV